MPSLLAQLPHEITIQYTNPERPQQGPAPTPTRPFNICAHKEGDTNRAQPYHQTLPRTNKPNNDTAAHLRIPTTLPPATSPLAPTTSVGPRQEAWLALRTVLQKTIQGRAASTPCPVQTTPNRHTSIRSPRPRAHAPGQQSLLAAWPARRVTGTLPRACSS